MEDKLDSAVFLIGDALQKSLNVKPAPPSITNDPRPKSKSSSRPGSIKRHSLRATALNVAVTATATAATAVTATAATAVTAMVTPRISKDGRPEDGHGLVNDVQDGHGLVNDDQDQSSASTLFVFKGTRAGDALSHHNTNLDVCSSGGTDFDQSLSADAHTRESDVSFGANLANLSLEEDVEDDCDPSLSLLDDEGEEVSVNGQGQQQQHYYAGAGGAMVMGKSVTVKRDQADVTLVLL